MLHRVTTSAIQMIEGLKLIFVYSKYTHTYEVVTVTKLEREYDCLWMVNCDLIE